MSSQTSKHDIFEVISGCISEINSGDSEFCRLLYNLILTVHRANFESSSNTFSKSMQNYSDSIFLVDNSKVNVIYKAVNYLARHVSNWDKNSQQNMNIDWRLFFDRICFIATERTRQYEFFRNLNKIAMFTHNEKILLKSGRRAFITSITKLYDDTGYIHSFTQLVTNISLLQTVHIAVPLMELKLIGDDSPRKYDDLRISYFSYCLACCKMLESNLIKQIGQLWVMRAILLCLVRLIEYLKLQENTTDCCRLISLVQLVMMIIQKGSLQLKNYDMFYKCVVHEVLCTCLTVLTQQSTLLSIHCLEPRNDMFLVESKRQDLITDIFYLLYGVLEFNDSTKSYSDSIPIFSLFISLENSSPYKLLDLNQISAISNSTHLTSQFYTRALKFQKTYGMLTDQNFSHMSSFLRFMLSYMESRYCNSIRSYLNINYMVDLQCYLAIRYVGEQESIGFFQKAVNDLLQKGREYLCAKENTLDNHDFSTLFSKRLLIFFKIVDQSPKFDSRLILEKTDSVSVREVSSRIFNFFAYSIQNTISKKVK